MRLSVVNLYEVPVLKLSPGVPPVDLWLARVPEEHAGASVRAQQHHLVRLQPPGHDPSAIGRSSQKLGAQREHDAGREVGDRQHLAAVRVARHHHVEHVPAGVVLIPGQSIVWQGDFESLRLHHVPHQDGVVGRVRHVHEGASRVGLLNCEILHAARGTRQAGQVDLPLHEVFFHVDHYHFWWTVFLRLVQALVEATVQDPRVVLLGKINFFNKKYIFLLLI